MKCFYYIRLMVIMSRLWLFYNESQLSLEYLFYAFLLDSVKILCFFFAGPDPKNILTPKRQDSENFKNTVKINTENKHRSKNMVQGWIYTCRNKIFWV